MRRAGRAVLALAVGALCLCLAVFPRYNPAVAVAERFNQDVAVASGATYISLRAINAALSMAEQVELGGSVVVTGNFQPLKWLEPVDDTVERVSNLIFAVAVLSGVLSLAMGPVAAIGFALIAVGLIGRGCCEVLPARWTGAPVRRVLGGCGGLGLMLAIGLPVAFALGAWAGELLTGSLWQEADATLRGIAAEAQVLIGEPGTIADERGWRETMSAYLGAAGMFWERADDLLQASLTLIGVFLLRMVLLPAVLALAILTILRRALSSSG